MSTLNEKYKAAKAANGHTNQYLAEKQGFAHYTSLTASWRYGAFKRQYVQDYEIQNGPIKGIAFEDDQGVIIEGKNIGILNDQELQDLKKNITRIQRNRK